MQTTSEEIQHIIPLKEGEELKLITRQHIIFFISKTLFAGLLVSILLIVGTIIGVYSGSLAFTSGYWTIAYFIISMVTLIYALQFHNYYLSKQILTNYRLIDYDQRGLFRAEVNETFLVNIENINTVQNNIWQTVFNYGSVDVQTAGEKTDLTTSGVVFENVPDPKSITALLSDLSQSAKQNSHH